MDRHRLVMTGLGLLLVATVAVAWAYWPHGDELAIPPQVERLAPGPGDQVPRQVPLTVDVEPGYEVRIFVPVDGVFIEVPLDEVDRGGAVNGVFVWAPGPGRTLVEWAQDQRVRVLIESTSGVVTVDELEWGFRTY